MGKKGTKASNIFQTLKGAGAWTSKDSKGPEIKKVGWPVTSPLKVDPPSNKLPEGKLPAGVQGPKTEGQVENEKMLAPPKNDKKADPKPYVKKGGKATGKMADYKLQSDKRKAEYDARGWKYDDTIKGYDKKGNKIKSDEKGVKPEKKVTVSTNVSDDFKKKTDKMITDVVVPKSFDKPKTKTENEKKLDDAKKNLSDAKGSRKQKRKDNRAKRKYTRIGNRADRKNRRAAKIKAGDNAAGVDTGKKRTDKIVNRALDAKEKGDTKQSDRLKKKLDRKGIKVTKLENDSPAKKKDPAGINPKGKPAKKGQPGAKAPKPKRRKVKSTIRHGKEGWSKMKGMKKHDGPDHGKKSPAKIAPLIAAAAPALIKGAAGAIGSNLGKKIS